MWAWAEARGRAAALRSGLCRPRSGSSPQGRAHTAPSGQEPWGRAEPDHTGGEGLRQDPDSAAAAVASSSVCGFEGLPPLSADFSKSEPRLRNASAPAPGVGAWASLRRGAGPSLTRRKEASPPLRVRSSGCVNEPGHRQARQEDEDLSTRPWLAADHRLLSLCHLFQARHSPGGAAPSSLLAHAPLRVGASPQGGASALRPALPAGPLPRRRGVRWGAGLAAPAAPAARSLWDLTELSEDTVHAC